MKKKKKNIKPHKHDFLKSCREISWYISNIENQVHKQMNQKGSNCSSIYWKRKDIHALHQQFLNIRINNNTFS